MEKPKVRFIGFEGEWKSSKASEIFMTRDERNRPDLPVLSACQDIRGMAPRSISGYDISHDKSNEVTYKRVMPRQFVIHLRSFQGGFAHSSVEGITSPAYTVFGFKDIQLHNDYYWKYVFMSKNFIERLKTITYGIRDGRSISFKEFADMQFIFPTCDEQQQIASYLKSLDSLIQEGTKKISSLRQLKSASLLSMFPQVGETKPRVRFEEFEGEWGKGKLSQFASRITRKNLKLESQLPLTISAIDGLISQNLFFNSIVASSNLSRYYLIKEGEFAYNKSYSNGYPFGAVKRLEKYDKGALSTLYIVFALNNNISSDYLVHFFDTTLWHSEVTKRAAEGARNHGLLNISAEDFLDIDIVFPSSLDEQQQIANFFRSLTNQISLETQRLDKLKQIKSACLDKMFV